MSLLDCKIGLLLSAVMLLLMTACTVVSKLPDNVTLHNSNAVKVEVYFQGLNRSSIKNELLLMARPRPNRSIGPLKIRAWLYSHIATPDTAHNILGWVKRKIGEPLVLLDSTALERSARQMQRHLFDKGYFANSVNYSVDIKKRKADVVYKAKIEKPYQIDSVFLPEANSPTTKAINELKIPLQLKRGEQFNAEQLRAEINRIAYDLRCHGFYDFVGKNLSFRLDTSQTHRTVNVYLDFKNKGEPSTEWQYSIKNVYIYADYTTPKDSSAYSDTLLVNGYHYIYKKTVKIKPQVLLAYMSIAPGKWYSQAHHEQSLRHLLELNLFKFTNIRFEKVDSAQLNCRIYLTPNKRVQISGETEVSNRSQSNVGGELGTALRLSFKDRNFLKGSEAFATNLFGGVEVAFNDTLSGFVNTINTSAEVSLSLPKFLSPIKVRTQSSYFRPKTNFLLKTNFLRRINFYTLNSYSLTYGFDWRENARKRHVLTPVSINLFSVINPSDRFLELLDNNPALAKSFEAQFILGSSYSYIYTNQVAGSSSSFDYFRLNFDIAGNLLYGIDRLLQATNTTSEPLTIFNNTYSQFFRIDADFRHYIPLSKSSSLIGRVYAGIGVPYGNADVLPYPKQFVSGGANSVRAFRIRSLGPGAFDSADDNSGGFDRTGELKLEANIEYRFDIWYIFKGAFFMDAGNVWTLRPNESFPNGNIKLNSIWQEWGIGGGAGLRLDFTYFVMRFDIATPFYNPNLTQGSRWRLDNISPFSSQWRRENLQLNLAIGYPF